MKQAEECPRCGSPEPHLHPSVQFGGEVETCPHEFHLRRTYLNRPEYVENVLRKRRWQEERAQLEARTEKAG